MKRKIDLHIHSVLSACADRENTISNIVRMSYVLKTDMIAIADHNSAYHCAAAKEAGKKYGVEIVPALEVTTAEEIHALCLFRKVESAEKLGRIIEASLPKYPLDRRLFAPQYVMDAEDRIRKEIPYLLNVASRFGILELSEWVSSHGGIVIPAHADKDANGIFAVLGGIPEEAHFTALEVTEHCPGDLRNEWMKKYHLIRSSDAHDLEQMCRTEFVIDLEENTVDALIDRLSERKSSENSENQK